MQYCDSKQYKSVQHISLLNKEMFKMQFKTKRIGLRLEPEIREKAEKLVKSGKFESLSELVRLALKEFLEKN